WPEARAIADREQRFYKAFGLGRGSFGQLIGLRVWARGIKAMRKGNRAGLPVGDVRRMPGFFLVRGDQIIWEYRSKNSADHPDFARIPAYVGE
ncbi:MAG TPA: AhpC/TSA family protein, partial [Blastocatellia bacterium]